MPEATMERFLLGDDDAFPSPDDLRPHTLDGYAYVRRPAHPHREQLKLGFYGFAARHLSIKREIVALVAAWQAYGIDALIVKGFYLAEFVYGSPGERPYADVDILIEEQHVEAACDAASDLGWEVPWRLGAADHMLALRGSEYRGHEAAMLRHPRLDLAIDLHHRLVHNNHNRIAAGSAQGRLTRAALQAAESVAWEGTTVRVPSPVDAVVFGLALNRCWGSDSWGVKPRDYADLEALIARHGLRRDEIVARADELGVGRTVRLYLARCDPFARAVRLRRPSWIDRRHWNLLVARERGPRDLQCLAMWVEDVVTDAFYILRTLPTVARSYRALRSGWPGREAVPAGAARSGAVSYRAWRDTRRAIHRSLRLLGVDEAQRGAVASLAAFELLRRRGVAVTLATPDLAAGHGRPTPRVLLEGRDVQAVAAPEPAS